MPEIKAIGAFVVKSIAFSVIFALIWGYGFRPNNSQANARAEATAKAQAEAYDNQVRQVNEQLAKSQEQQRRMEKLISSQEAQNARYEAVLQQWEKQTKLRN